MSTKKALYKPAPDVQIQPASATLSQGSELGPMATPVPTIKQGILEKKQQSEKLLSSTLKSSKTNNGGTKPVIVCHKPAAIHAAVATRDAPGGKLVKDTVSAPLAVSITDASVNKSASGGNSRAGTKKKVKARFVESRYRNAPSGGRHLRNESGSSNSSSYLSKTNKSKDLQGSYSAQTPTTGTAPGKTSTPFSKAPGKQLFDWNTSAIERNQSYAGPPRGEAKSITRPKAAVHGEADVLDPQLIYLRYLQWHYRNQKVKASMATKAKQVSSELKFMHEKVGSVRSQNEVLENEQKAIEKQIHLEKQLQTQAVCLGPILEKMGSCLDGHATLISNLDTTRHNLALNGVSDPDPEMLERTLEETRNLLGQVNILTHSQAPAINAMSEGSRRLDSWCKDEAELIPLTQKLVYEELSSTLKQASLVAQLQD